MDAVGVTLAEEAFAVFGAGRRYRPDATSRAVAREPEHGCMAGVDRPDKRRCLGIGTWGMRQELAKRRILAEMPQRKGALPRVGRCRFPAQQVLGIVGVHSRSISHRAR